MYSMGSNKCEAILEKTKDLLSVKKNKDAMELISGYIKTPKRQNGWMKAHEEMMMMLAELCVDQKKNVQFKEAIHQYKFMTIQMNPKSLEDVVKHYINLVKVKIQEAGDTPTEILPEIEDLDSLDTPESLIFNALSEGSKVRQEVAKVTPWLKFLWESYRQSLELLRNNSKFERLYHDIAQETLEFCEKYDRKSEFRKLSEILRNHTMQFQATAKNQVQVSNTVESYFLHLENRLKMLDFALKFELYNEAFKAVEDVWNLLNTSNIPPKPRILANYYLKTSHVFFESGTSYMLHAAALHKLFFYSRENRRNMSATELEQLALQLIIATLAVPLPNNREPVDPLLESGEITNPVKQKTLSMLLNLPNPPTRASLIKDIQNNHVYNLVDPKIANFFKLLESDYKPLSVAREALPILAWLREHPELHVYTELIQNVVVSKTLIQIGKVYKTIKISEFEKLCPYVAPLKLQTIVINLIRNLELPIRLDHRCSVLKFDVYTDLGISQRNDTNLVSQEIDGISTLARQLSKFSVAIYEVAEFIGYVDTDKNQDREWVRQCYTRKIQESHQMMMNRKNLIEDRKEEIERFEEENQRKLTDQMRQQDDKRRREQEKRFKEEQEQARKKRIEEQIEIQKTKIKTVIKQTDEKQRLQEEGEEKFRKLEQKNDFFQRALRLEEIPRITQYQLDTYEKSQQHFDNQQEKRRNDSRLKFLHKMKSKELFMAFQSEIEHNIERQNEETNKIHEEQLKKWESKCEALRTAYREKRMVELLEEQKTREIIKQKQEAEEKERLEKEKIAQTKKAYVPPHLRNRR